MVSNGDSGATPTAQLAAGVPSVGVVVQMISGPVPLWAMLAGHAAVATKMVTSDFVQVVWTWLASNVVPTVQGADAMGPWLLAGMGNVQMVVIRPASIPLVHAATGVAAGYAPAAPL